MNTSFADDDMLLPTGTRGVEQEAGDRELFGTVMPYDQQFSQGFFPVRWDTEFWEIQHIGDVQAVTPEQEAEIRNARLRKARAFGLRWTG